MKNPLSNSPFQPKGLFSKLKKLRSGNFDIIPFRFIIETILAIAPTMKAFRA